MQEKDLSKKQEVIEDYYDEYVEFQKNIGVNARHYSILEKLKAAGLNGKDNVLEIGCGIGTFSGLLSRAVPNGHVTAMDISGASIQYANDTNTLKNITYIHADAANHNYNDTKFDVIVFPDVIEHIPVELHSQLFQKMSNILKPNGFMFIHIPNPYYLQWCHENRPDLLQVIDQPITTDILINNTYPHGLYIAELKSYAIWIKAHDYQYIVLKKNNHQDFTKNLEIKPTFMEKLKYKLNGRKK